MRRRIIITEILFIVPSLDVERYKGLARFSYELYKRIEKKFSVEIYEALKTKEYKSYLKAPFFIPFKVFSSKAKIVHYATPSQAVLPFFTRKKTIVTFHDFLPFELPKTALKKEKIARLKATIAWWMASKCNYIVSISSLTAKKVLEKYKRESKIIPLGVDEKFKPMNVKKEKITLGFFANFGYRKGFDLALEVFKKVKQKYDVKFVVAGGKLESLYLKMFNVDKMIEGLNDVEVFGYIPEEKIVEFYNSFDFYLYTSRAEGFGLPILEAQKCGIPTFVFSWAEIPKEVTEKAIKCENTEDMANKIIELIENKEKYEMIRRDSIEYANQFTWEKTAEEYGKIYEKILKGME